MEQSNTAYNNPFKYNGKELDEATGLYYYGARYYDPKTSIWLSVDPLAEKYPSISPYVYVANNPMVYVDPDGRDIVPYFVNSLENDGSFRATKGYLSSNFYKAMVDYGKTEQGEKFLLQFLKKDQSFAGVTATADGIYHNQTLNIIDLRLKDESVSPQQRNSALSANGEPFNGYTRFRADGGKLNVDIMMNTFGDSDHGFLTETFGHETLLHGYKINDNLNYLQEVGDSVFNKTAGITSANKDHSAVRDQNIKHKGYSQYSKFMKELQVISPKRYNSILKATRIEYEQKYKNTPSK